ncbi:MAG TPA: peptidoglycan-binding domain-containing protein [Pyrinomonadaceae bacterium]|jgi:N-acetylmuramoyl-L-alanine amidase
MKNLAFGASGEDVKRLQERLREFGFYDGELTGEFDEKTKNSVINFQKSEGLTPDGLVGIMTQHELDLMEPEPAGGAETAEENARNA